MSTQQSDPAIHEQRLNTVIAAYDSAVRRKAHRQERNEVRRQFLAEHADLDAELQEYFDDEHAADLALRGLRGIPRRLPDFDKFERIEYIGHGGMGVVYEAVEHVEEGKRTVALKVGRTDDDRKRLRYEAAALVELDHSHIVPVFRLVEHRGEPYLVMKFLRGGRLQPAMPRSRGEQRQVAGLMVKIARALQFAHEGGFLHRDLKPDNILLDDRGEPYITDLGLAKRIGAGQPFTATERNTAGSNRGSIVGAAAYISPEQARGERATSRSDVYGLGAILYELLTEQPPYQADTWAEVRRRVLAADCAPAAPRARNPDVDSTLAARCLKCLEKEPGRRYQSAADLAMALEAWLENRPVPEDRLPRRLWLWCRRNPLGVGLLVVAFAFLALLGWRAADALQEPARAQRVLAHNQAKTIQRRLKEFQQAVELTARNEDLGRWLTHDDRTRLQDFILKAAETRVDLDGDSPFLKNWFILNRDGEIIARSPAPDPQLKAKVLSERDYFKGALELAGKRGGSPVYVSRVYQSIILQDKRYKFGVSAALRHEGAIVGVLVATVTTSPDMGLVDLKDGDLVTSLLAEKDPFVVTGEQRPQASASQYLVLLHPAYQPGDQPVWFPKAQLHELQAGVSEAYRDPAGELHEDYSGRWLAAFAKVEGTSFIVVVQRPSPTLATRTWIALGLVVLVILAVAAVGHHVHRKKRSASAAMRAGKDSSLAETQSWVS